MTLKSERQAFADAKQRCNNPKHSRYKDWGGRGIQVLFSSFDDFYKEIGPKPKGYSLDRIDNNGHYCAGNVKWSTREEQQNNRRTLKQNTTGITGVRKVQAKGLVTDTWQAFCRELGKFKQLYTGPDFSVAVDTRKDYERSHK